MTVVLGATLLALRIVGGVLAVLLAAVAVVLFLPVGLDIRWSKKEGAHWQARFGPLSLPLYPFPEEMPADPLGLARTQKAGKKPKRKSADAPGLDAQAGKTVSATEEGAPPSSASAAPQKQGQGKNAPGPEPRETPSPMPGADEMDGLLKAGRILARAMWPHRAWLLQKTRVLHLCVYWTVTGEDAADTAVTYGRRIALFNTLLSIARDHLEIRSDSLRLEPDFTGEQKEKRSFSCQLRARAYIMIKIIRILLRRDPQSGQTPLQQILAAFGE